MFDPRVHVGTAALIINPLNRLLMMQRSPEASHAGGSWSVPGGWLDYGETPEQGVLRELNEEVDVTATQARFVGLVTNRYPPPVDQVTCLFYKVPYNIMMRATIMEPNKAVALRWVPINEIKNLKLMPTMQSFMESYSLHLI